MEISQHIKSLLLTNERVILGGFGAFDSKHIPARIDKDTKTMTPPFKIVVFNPGYKQDEGLLAKHMAEKEGVSYDNAKEQITEYVKTIKTKLDSGEKVVFQDLGEFKKADDGTYSFLYLSEENLLVDSFGLPKVSLSEQDKIRTEVSEKNVRKAPIKDENQKSVSRKPKEKPKPVKKAKPVKLKKEKAKKKRFWPVFLIIVGLIGIFLAAVYFFKPDLWKKGYNFSSEKIAYLKSNVFGSDKEKLEIITPDEVNNQEKEEINDENIGTDTTVTDEDVVDTTVTEKPEDVQPEDNQTENIAENNQVEENVKEDEQVSVNTDAGSAAKGKYYIIIGSVKTKASAQKEKQRYAAKGITTNVLYVQKMDRYRISIGEFTSAKAAQDFFTDFENQHGTIDAWVWEKR